VAKKEGCVARIKGGCGEKVVNSGEKCKFAGEKKMYHRSAQRNMSLLQISLQSAIIVG
jgi:hypothetical protein